MTNDTPVNKNHSLGNLRPAKKTKPKSPDCTGKIRVRRNLVFRWWKELEETQADDVSANLAAWMNADAFGPFMTIEISAKYEPKASDIGRFAQFFK